MRGIVCREFGPFDRLEEEDLPELTPGARQVVVQVKAAGVNFVDALMVQGKHQLRPPLPMTPGSEVAGVVVAVGADVADLKVGDHVFGMCMAGGFASSALMHERAARPVPPGLSSGQAASFVHSYGTAWFSLTRSTRVAPLERVVVLGAGGGVGLAAVDVAKHLGAEVIAAASTEEKLGLAVRQGADATVNYARENLKERVRDLAGGGADVVVDPVGGDHAELALRSLAPGGRYLVVGFASGRIPSLPLNQVLLGNRSILGVEWGSWARRNAAENNVLLDELVDAAAAGRLHPIEPTPYPLGEAAQALADVEGGRVTGKLILVP